jgi:pimeloyl-ACP methyl ester carboxylesterase
MKDAIPSIVPNDKHMTHHYAENNGVHIHHASIGKGPVIVMIQGFPDFWYTWLNQMVVLAWQSSGSRTTLSTMPKLF